eukprot:2349385-Rhodomonas_salina.1
MQRTACFASFSFARRLLSTRSLPTRPTLDWRRSGFQAIAATRKGRVGAEPSGFTLRGQCSRDGFDEIGGEKREQDDTAEGCQSRHRPPEMCDGVDVACAATLNSARHSVFQTASLVQRPLNTGRTLCRSHEMQPPTPSSSNRPGP